MYHTKKRFINETTITNWFHVKLYFIKMSICLKVYSISAAIMLFPYLVHIIALFYTFEKQNEQK